MSLREWYAGQAVAGLMASDADRGAKTAAVKAFQIADEMLLQRHLPTMI